MWSRFLSLLRMTLKVRASLESHANERRNCGTFRVLTSFWLNFTVQLSVQVHPLPLRGQEGIKRKFHPRACALSSLLPLTVGMKSSCSCLRLARPCCWWGLWSSSPLSSALPSQPHHFSLYKHFRNSAHLHTTLWTPSSRLPFLCSTCDNSSLNRSSVLQSLLLRSSVLQSLLLRSSVLQSLLLLLPWSHSSQALHLSISPELLFRPGQQRTLRCEIQGFLLSS